MKNWWLGLNTEKRKIAIVVMAVLSVLILMFTSFGISRHVYQVNLDAKYPEKVIADVIITSVQHRDVITWNNEIETKSDVINTLRYRYDDIVFVFNVPVDDMPFGFKGVSVGEQLVVQFNPEEPQQVVISRGDSTVYTAEIYEKTA